MDKTEYLTKERLVALSQQVNDANKRDIRKAKRALKVAASRYRRRKEHSEMVEALTGGVDEK